MTTGPSGDGLTTATAYAALVDVCLQVGLNPAGARLLRLGENAMYALPGDGDGDGDRDSGGDGRSGGVVVRIARSEGSRDRVELEVALAAWLADLNFPAVRLAEELPQVIAADGRLATFWKLETESGPAPTAADLGRILRRFHLLPAPPFRLPPFDPFRVVPARLAQPGAADPEDVTFLANLHKQLVESYRELHPPTPLGLIHGDAHRSNLLPTEAGVLLLDFEAVAWGPREWDLTPMALAVERFGLPHSEYAAFAQAYRRDVTQWDGYRTMAAARELTMTTWLMQNISQSQDIAEEFNARMTSMREGDHARQWRAF